MIDTLYIESGVANHPRVQTLVKRFPEANRIECDNYTEVFNRKAQNFRLQKKKPALILANKHKGLVLPTPRQYGIGARHNYYFSHMLNCLYDCRYCFLQGMFQSAHYVLFINYEDFNTELTRLTNLHQHEPVHFFSGYDCDSLALEPVTGFVEHFLPFFEKHPHCLLEIRTKSTQARSLLNREPINNCVIAFSFTPENISEALEHKVPAIEKRLQTMVALQQTGWQVGLRFDPLIYTDSFQHDYSQLFETLFNRLDSDLIHSVSLGSFRLPRDYFRKLEKLYPDEPFLASTFTEEDKQVGYSASLREDMLQFAASHIQQYIDSERFFPCHEMI